MIAPLLKLVGCSGRIPSGAAQGAGVPRQQERAADVCARAQQVPRPTVASAAGTWNLEPLGDRAPGVWRQWRALALDVAHRRPCGADTVVHRCPRRASVQLERWVLDQLVVQADAELTTLRRVAGAWELLELIEMKNVDILVLVANMVVMIYSRVLSLLEVCR